VSSLSPEANILFNSGLLTTAGNNNNAAASSRINEGYLVDKEGAINFPVIGKITLARLTKEEATTKMTEELKQHVKNPIVNVRFLNFKVTVIGEVNRPSTFTIPTEKINIMEALGLAGDMTAFGKRENVLIIREKDGVRSTTRINMNNKDILNSPYFYLQQNDIVYVEPDNRTKVAQTSANNRYIPIVVASITAIAIFLSNIYN
jgi:polysaccharide export outer membrane protein